MPPAADWALDSVNVYGPVSDPPAVRTKTAWRMVLALMSRRTSVQPAGAVIVGPPRADTTASITSPLTTPVGAGMTSEVAVALLAELAARKAMPVPGGGTSAVVNDQSTGARALPEVSVMPDVRWAV